MIRLTADIAGLGSNCPGVPLSQSIFTFTLMSKIWNGANGPQAVSFSHMFHGLSTVLFAGYGLMLRAVGHNELNGRRDLKTSFGPEPCGSVKDVNIEPFGVFRLMSSGEPDSGHFADFSRYGKTQAAV